jgi:hypothetical protein
MLAVAERVIGALARQPGQEFVVNVVGEKAGDQHMRKGIMVNRGILHSLENMAPALMEHRGTTIANNHGGTFSATEGRLVGRPFQAE